MFCRKKWNLPAASLCTIPKSESLRASAGSPTDSRFQNPTHVIGARHRGEKSAPMRLDSEMAFRNSARCIYACRPACFGTTFWCCPKFHTVERCGAKKASILAAGRRGARSENTNRVKWVVSREAACGADWRRINKKNFTRVRVKFKTRRGREYAEIRK